MLSSLFSSLFKPSPSAGTTLAVSSWSEWTRRLDHYLQSAEQTSDLPLSLIVEWFKVDGQWQACATVRRPLSLSLIASSWPIQAAFQAPCSSDPLVVADHLKALALKLLILQRNTQSTPHPWACSMRIALDSQQYPDSADLQSLISSWMTTSASFLEQRSTPLTLSEVEPSIVAWLEGRSPWSSLQSSSWSGHFFHHLWSHWMAQRDAYSARDIPSSRLRHLSTCANLPSDVWTPGVSLSPQLQVYRTSEWMHELTQHPTAFGPQSWSLHTTPFDWVLQETLRSARLHRPEALFCGWHWLEHHPSDRSVPLISWVLWHALHDESWSSLTSSRGDLLQFPRLQDHLTRFWNTLGFLLGFPLESQGPSSEDPFGMGFIPSWTPPSFTALAQTHSDQYDSILRLLDDHLHRCIHESQAWTSRPQSESAQQWNRTHHARLTRWLTLWKQARS